MAADTKSFNSYIDHPWMDCWRELCINDGELCHYNRGDEFVSIGHIARYIGYIKSGTLKFVVYDDRGNESVVGFASDDEFVADWPFALNGDKASVAIIANSSCEIYQFPVKTLAQRMQNDPDLSELIAKSTELLFYQTYDRYISLYRLSPEQRYADLIRKYSNLFEKFSLKDIASFLNITPTYLSRIRKKINNKPHKSN